MRNLISVLAIFGAVWVVGFLLRQYAPVSEKEDIATLTYLAERGLPEAQYLLADRYYLGDGVPEDYAETARLYRLAAEQEFADAQYELGFMCKNGTGVPLSFERAYMWFRVGKDKRPRAAATAV